MRSDRYAVQPKKKRRRTLRLLLLLIFILAAVNAGVVYYSYRTTLDSLDLKFKDNAPSVEFGSVSKAMDFVGEATGDVTVSNEFLDTDTIGSKELTYTVSRQMFGGLLTPAKEFTLTCKVVDTVAPMVLWNGSGTVLERGTEFDLSNVFGYGDNADPAPSTEIKGKVNMDKNGTYPIHVKITDSSGNRTESDVTVEVADSVPYYTDDYPRIQFGDFVAKYAGKGRSFGIDVSEWQGDINFKAVRSAGCEFVIIRIGYSVDGKVTVDGKFDKNIKNAKAAGLKVGVYMYSYDNTTEKVRAAADWIVNKLGGTSLDLPVAFDWEDFGEFQTYNMSFADLNRLYDAFSDVITSGGYECMLYGSLNYLEKVWEKTDTRPVWLAHYTDKTSYKGPYRIWQAGSTGRIKGISGDVDLDIMYY